MLLTTTEVKTPLEHSCYVSSDITPFYHLKVNPYLMDKYGHRIKSILIISLRQFFILGAVKIEYLHLNISSGQ